jgi:hypothetical protein
VPELQLYADAVVVLDAEPCLDDAIGPGRAAST